MSNRVVTPSLMISSSMSRHSRKSGSGVPATGHMYSDLFCSFTISFIGAILFLLVDKYEPEGPLARLLKFLVLFVAGVAVPHGLQPYGLALF
jgi:hypothetical protein